MKLDFADLEKILLDANGEVKLEISNAIVQEFTRRHLKGLAVELSEGVVHGMLQEALDTMSSTVPGKIRLSDELRGIIDTAVRTHVHALITEAVRGYFDKINLEAEIRDRAHHVLNDVLRGPVQEMKKKIDAVLRNVIVVS